MERNPAAVPRRPRRKRKEIQRSRKEKGGKKTMKGKRSMSDPQREENLSVKGRLDFREKGKGKDENQGENRYLLGKKKGGLNYRGQKRKKGMAKVLGGKKTEPGKVLRSIRKVLSKKKKKKKGGKGGDKGV